MNKSLSFYIFLTVVITVYSLLNFYFIRKYNLVITLKMWPKLLTNLFLSILVIMPVVTMVFNWKNNNPLPVFTSYLSYSWLAFLFLFLVIQGIGDIIFFISEKSGINVTGDLSKIVFLSIIALIIIILIYGKFEAEQIQIERVLIESEKVPEAVEKIKIIQISDIHFSSLVGLKVAKNINKIIKKEQADLILSTGDLLDRGIEESEKISEIMSSTKAPLGKYAVTGNHEFITGIKQSMSFTSKSDFDLLRNRSIEIDGWLNLVGIDDISANRFIEVANVREKDLFRNLNTDNFTILLKHQPKVNQESLEFFDLQLSGHTHGGQIFPFYLLVKLFYPYISGLYIIDGKTKLYVNRGTGTWGPPYRFLTSPEITVFELRTSLR